MKSGYWRKDGMDIPISSMEDSHIKNACRYLRKVVLEQSAGNWRESCHDKLIEMGAEAQRRGLCLQGDITEEAFNQIIDGWQAEYSGKTKSRMGVLEIMNPAPPKPKLKKNERLEFSLEERLLDDL